MNEPRSPDRRTGHDGHYFVDDPDLASEPRRVEVLLPDVSFTMRTDRGVFSHGHLDAGTSLLLRTVPAPPPGGVLLDLGCGAGPIALAAGLRSRTTSVWAVDVNTRALELCRSNVESLGLDHVTVAAPDAVPDDLWFDAIWSNPPIRIGKDELHALLTRWLTRLTDDGEAWLVVQKHLGADSLQRWLDSQGFRTERVASKAGFRILRIRSSSHAA